MHNYHKIVSPWKRTDPKSKTVNTEVFSDEYIELLKDIQWIGTEKIDGENLNFYYDGNHVSWLKTDGCLMNYRLSSANGKNALETSWCCASTKIT